MSDPNSASAPAPQAIDRGPSRVLAYRRTPGRGPGVVFLGGLMSDMTGTKATALEVFCRDREQAFVRFDYFGHGESSGAFTEGTIGLWAADAVTVLDELTEGPQVLVGSSLGGWIMLLAALARRPRIAGLVGIASAVDFTEDLLWARMGPGEREALDRDGVYYQPNAYGDAYPITRALIEEGRNHLLLRGPIALECPVSLIHGMDDPDVPVETSMRLAQCLASQDVTVALFKGGGHRLSEPEDLKRLCQLVGAMLDRLS